MKLKLIPKYSQLINAKLTISDLNKIEKNLKKQFDLKTIKYKNTIEIKDKVIIVKGSFEHFKGYVKSIDKEQNKALVTIKVLGRETDTLFKLEHIKQIDE